MTVFDILAAVWLFSAINGLLLEALDLGAEGLRAFDPRQRPANIYSIFTSPSPQSSRSTQ